MTPVTKSKPGISQTEISQGYRPLWELTDDEFAEFQVTPLSKVKDDVWKRSPTTPGVGLAQCTLRWDFSLFDGSKLTDTRHRHRLAWCKKLMALILHVPAGRIVPSPTSTNSFQRHFTWLVSWMALHGIHTPDELDVHGYIEDLPRYISTQRDEDALSSGIVESSLHILSYLWLQRISLQKWNVPILNENPFRDRSLNQLAIDISTKTRGWIPPLPDEVATLLFNKIAWWMGPPADDVIRLLEYVADPRASEELVIDRMGRRFKSGKGHSARVRRATKFIGEFTFSKLPGESNPWQEDLNGSYESEFGISVFTQVRILYEAVRSACSLCIQGLSGMRISELLGIEAGFDHLSGLPTGVRIEESATGLYEVFVIHTVLSKTVEGIPREMDWVLGMRPKGSQEEPLPVRALRVLNGLNAPWLSNAKTSKLHISAVSGDALFLKTARLSAMSSHLMSSGMKSFISRWIDFSKLPAESRHKMKDNDLVEWRELKGSVFKSHMLRKSWAQFMFAVDPRLMPAIQLQFHHLSMAMTDTGYIGNNMLLLNEMDSVGTQARNLMILESVLGHNPLAGKMGEALELATRNLAQNIQDLPTVDAYKEVVKFCEHAQLPIFFSPHGACMPLQTHKMRCHDEAGTSLLLRKGPNARNRQPSLCAGCSCFVLDARHSDFWASRYLDNWLAYKRAERTGNVDGFKVIKERAEQAGKLLNKIGVKVTHLDLKIEHALEADHVQD